VAKLIILKNMKNEHYHLPKPPNFIRRVSDDFPVPYGELSDAEIRKVGKAWTENLLARAQEQREAGSTYDHIGPRSGRGEA
jgi:hypothetical protein